MTMFLQSVILKYCRVLIRIMTLCYIPLTKIKKKPLNKVWRFNQADRFLGEYAAWHFKWYSSNIQDKIKHQYYIISTTLTNTLRYVSNISFKHDKSCIPILCLFITISKILDLLIQKQGNGIKGQQAILLYYYYYYFKVAFVETEFRHQNYQNRYVSL